MTPTGRSAHRFTALLACVVPAGAAVAQTIPAFPGAEGFGAGATMRKNNLPFAGEVYHVTSLADTLTQGTLRHAVRESGFPAGGRIVVFDVGGTINLTASLDIKNVNGLYIAGQTAPSPITITGETSQITSSSGKTTQNVIVRNIAFRKGTGNGEDAITFAGSGLGTNLILDHVSASWAEDENMSVANNNTNVTVQYSMINDALVSNHAYGSLIRPRINSNVTFHHNLYAHNSSRQARFGTYDAMKLTADFRNNVVYNWRDRASYAGGSSEAEQEFVDVNYVGNYLVAGPGTIGSATLAFSVDKNVDTRAYQSGNFIDSDKQANPGGQPNGSDTGWGMFTVTPPVTDQTLTQMGTPFAMAPVATQSAQGAYNQVIGYVGSRWWDRDAIDQRVIGNVTNFTGPTIGAAAPNATELNGVLTAPTVSRPAGWDTDNDGMPNAWETAHGLNPTAANPGADFDNDGYSNLEEFLNEAGAFPAPQAINWSGGVNRYALNANWSLWQPSRFDTVDVNSGTAIVDAVGQHAGTLRIGQLPGGVGTVEVSAGWLDVAADVHVGSFAGAGTLRLNGGSLAIGSALNLNPTGTLVLGGGTLALGAAGQLNWNGGTLRTTVNQGIGLNANIGAAGAKLDTTDRTVTYSGNLAGAGGFTKLGTGTLTLTGASSYTGGTNVNAGTLQVRRMHENNAVSIAAGAKLQVLDSMPTLPAHPSGDNAFVSRPSSLTIAAGGTLDLGNNDLILDYAGASPAEAIESLVANGFNGGGWDGTGITSSTAAADPSFVLAVADNALLLQPFGDGGAGDDPLFAGQVVDETSVLVKFTHRVDLDLDGLITGNDAAIFNAFFNEGQPATWQFGDLDYDGVYSGNDAAIFNGFYNESVASVPEPAAMGVLALAGVGLLGRRRGLRRVR